MERRDFRPRSHLERIFPMLTPKQATPIEAHGWGEHLRNFPSMRNRVDGVQCEIDLAALRPMQT
jgi:hypothetical protein